MLQASLGLFKRRHVLIIAVLVILANRLQACVHAASAYTCEGMPARVTLDNPASSARRCILSLPNNLPHLEVGIIGQSYKHRHRRVNAPMSASTCMKSFMTMQNLQVRMGMKYVHLNIANATEAASQAAAKVAAAKVGQVLELAHVKVLARASLILLILIHPLVPVHLQSRTKSPPDFNV